MGTLKELPTEGGRLDGESRPQGCLLYDSNTPRPPALPEVCGRVDMDVGGQAPTSFQGPWST